MAKVKTSYKPGQSGNPNGRPKLSAELKKVRELANESLAALYEKYREYSFKKLHDLDKKAMAGKVELAIEEHYYVRCFMKSLNDPRYMEALLNRIVGKPKQPIEHGGDEEKPFVFLDYGKLGKI